MNIEDLTIKQVRQLGNLFGGTTDANECFEVGKPYIIRTVTMMYTGRVKAINKFAVKLGNAAWIADSGRYSNALHTGNLEEVEPYPNECYVSIQSIVDFAIWEHELPFEAK